MCVAAWILYTLGAMLTVFTIKVVNLNIRDAPSFYEFVFITVLWPAFAVPAFVLALIHDRD